MGAGFDSTPIFHSKECARVNHPICGWFRYRVLLLGARDGLFHPNVRLAFVFVVDFAEARVSHEAISTLESSLGVQAHFGRSRFDGGAFAFFDEHAPKTAFALLWEHRYAADSPAR